jgi:AcrB/AcrD/AcrF family
VTPLPQVDFPTIQVTTQLPGASPETMASSVTAPLERQFAQIAGVAQMTSSSTLGNSSITVQFDLNRNIDAAAQDILTAIDIPLQFFDRRRVDRLKGKIATVRQAPHRAVGPQGLALWHRPDRSVDNHRQHFGGGGLTDRRVHSAKVNLSATLLGATGADGLIVTLERIGISDVARVPHDFETGQQLHVTRRPAGCRHADALALIGGGVVGPVLLQRVQRRGLVGETGFLVAPEHDGAAPGSLATRPDLEPRRSARVTVWNWHSRRRCRCICGTADVVGHIPSRWLPVPDRGLRCRPGG